VVDPRQRLGHPVARVPQDPEGPPGNVFLHPDHASGAGPAMGWGATRAPSLRAARTSP
jgi:hypothetical protein